MEKATENNEIVLFETEDHEVKLSVPIDNETVWLTQAQMKELFNVDRTVVTKHINNIFKEDELDEKSNVQILHIANSDRPVKYEGKPHKLMSFLKKNGHQITEYEKGIYHIIKKDHVDMLLNIKLKLIQTAFYN